MNKLLGLFLLALACCMPGSAQALNCFWVGGTGTWDNSSTAHWAPTSGGGATGCQTSGAVPASGDTVTFDASSGGGTVTVAATINGSNTITTLTANAFTGTLDFDANDPNITISSAANLSGTGARKYLLGQGTFTFTGAAALFDLNTTTNLDPTSDTTANFVFTAATTSIRTFAGGGRTYGSLTVSNNSSKFPFATTGTNTYASITIGSGNTVLFPQGVTTTISGALTVTGTSSAQSGIQSNGVQTGAATLSVGSASTMDWVGVTRITRAGAGTLNGTNCFDLGGNSSLTSCAIPSGGGGGGRIIGG